MMTPREFVSTTLMTHEGKLSLHKADNGNWFSRRRFKAGLPQRRFQGTLVGSMYGVTAYALAEHRGIDEVTRDMMASLKREEAIDIALTGYWRKPRLDTLEPFSPVLLAVLDMAYNAGPDKAVELLQEVIGTAADGDVGPKTRRAYSRYIERFGHTEAMVAYVLKRKEFYRSIAKGSQRKFLNGWIRRADSFLPGTPWWKEATG